MSVENVRPTGYADALSVSSTESDDTGTWALSSEAAEGVAGFFSKSVDNSKYALQVLSATGTSEGLYVSGTIFTTVPLARGIETSRGAEPVFGVAAADVEVIASGQGALWDGAARVDFDRLFAESISGPSGLRVTVTPIGGWSALYVEGIDANGFDVRSDSGDKDVEFHWVAVGRAKEHERRPDVTIPDPEEEERVARLKKEEMLGRRPPRPDPPEIVRVER
jgi:hypothetical protein